MNLAMVTDTQEQKSFRN